MDRVKQPIPPPILAFARSIREQFGPGVKLYKPTPWPGGVDGGRRP